ncbi:MAG: DNA-3-methyladenine glycosylase [Phycisphaerales bacterium]|nr:DNA-3-methyladenine glycosylase [Phycisphaerales bacterium]
MSTGTNMFEQPAEKVARNLIGCTLQRTLSDGTILAGTITETEAYIGPVDRASHAFENLRTKRNESMWMTPGTAYVYFTYGMHFCFNISCDREGFPSAVLIRGIHPTQGIEQMRLHRNEKPRKSILRDSNLCDGPAKLCQALKIDRNLDGENLLQSTQVAILQGDAIDDTEVKCTPRVGIGYAQDWIDKPLRWVRILDL